MIALAQTLATIAQKELDGQELTEDENRHHHLVRVTTRGAGDLEHLRTGHDASSRGREEPRWSPTCTPATSATPSRGGDRAIPLVLYVAFELERQAAAAVRRVVRLLRVHVAPRQTPHRRGMDHHAGRRPGAAAAGLDQRVDRGVAEGGRHDRAPEEHRAGRRPAPVCLLEELVEIDGVLVGGQPQAPHPPVAERDSPPRPERGLDGRLERPAGLLVHDHCHHSLGLGLESSLDVLGWRRPFQRAALTAPTWRLASHDPRVSRRSSRRPPASGTIACIASSGSVRLAPTREARTSFAFARASSLARSCFENRTQRGAALRRLGGRHGPHEEHVAVDDDVAQRGRSSCGPLLVQPPGLGAKRPDRVGEIAWQSASSTHSIAESSTLPGPGVPHPETARQ